MIHFLVAGTRARAHLAELFDHRDPDIWKIVAVHGYEDAVVTKDRGPWVFMGADQPCGDGQFVHIARLERDLIVAGATIWNTPSSTLHRFALLQLLYERGINPFMVYRPGKKPARLPVFVRTIHHFSESARAPKLWHRWPAARSFPPNAMIAEWVDTRCQDGLYRKYSVQRLGDTFVPRHVLASPSWYVKHEGVVTPAIAREEEIFVASPISDLVMDIFRLACIDYGRIDYSFLPDGRICVWEINLDPVLVPSPKRLHPLRHSSQATSATRIIAAIRAASV